MIFSRQDGEIFLEHVSKTCLVSGHDLSRAEKRQK